LRSLEGLRQRIRLRFDRKGYSDRVPRTVSFQADECPISAWSAGLLETHG
jgi:hypothetical protein